MTCWQMSDIDDAFIHKYFTDHKGIPWIHAGSLLQHTLSTPLVHLTTSALRLSLGQRSCHIQGHSKSKVHALNLVLPGGYHLDDS